MLLEQALAGEIEVAISQPILHETLRVLRDKFHWSLVELETAQITIESCTLCFTPVRRLDIIKGDEPDNRILECAEISGSEYIVSGDNDLLRLGQYGNARIVKVRIWLMPCGGQGLGGTHRPDLIESCECEGRAIALRV
jgi:putative PIN family toxin of toxin-antitoxin system